jgi:glycosyltransferase involved in cell wall biosynthesis
MPALSVLLPVRNAGPWIENSLASLWRQTCADFEVIAIDDGSTDDSAERLERAACDHPRLRVLRGPHLGLPTALNTALAAARADLVVRHDADDLSHRRRFELQRASLDHDRSLTVLGTRLRIFPSGEGWVGMRRWAAWHNTLLTHEEIARDILVDSTLAHATAMIRRPALEAVGGWAERGWPEDVDLWLRLLARGARFAKLPRTLYAWRQHVTSATRDARYSQGRFDALRLDALRAVLLDRDRDVTVVGVGRGLRRWCELLEAEGRRVTRVAARGPTPGVLAGLAEPTVLVYGAPAVRALWREALARSGRVEGRTFVFVV